jgi:hypothetical protein
MAYAAYLMQRLTGADNISNEMQDALADNESAPQF